MYVNFKANKIYVKRLILELKNVWYKEENPPHVIDKVSLAET